MPQKRIRIIDIAKKAGVSPGTVDRVVNNRGNVSESSRKKVTKAIQELGYKKNLIASRLAAKKEIKVGVVIPAFNTDLYWQEVQQGIIAASDKFTDFGLDVSLYPFDLFNELTFNQQIDYCINQKLDGVLVAPQFYQASIKAFHLLNKADIPISIINTFIDHEKLVSYIGQDSYKSGYLAAKLLDTNCKKKNFLVLDIANTTDKGKHYIDKLEGFQSYFSSTENVQIHHHTISNFQEQKKFKTSCDQLLKEYQPDGVFVTNSRTHLLLDAIDSAIPDFHLVGFDLVKPNIDYLKNNKIDFLINQNAFQQGYLGIINIANHLLFQIQPNKVQYLPLDIVVSENYWYYTNHSRYFDFVF